MPIVTVQMYPGRSIDQKRTLVKALTDAMVQHAGTRPDNLHVVIEEVEKENWSIAGILGSDREAQSQK